MTIQKNIGHCFVFCSFFLFISHGSFTKDIESGQEDLLLGSARAMADKCGQEKTQKLSSCSRLSKYGVSMLTALLVGLANGYVSAKIDSVLIGDSRELWGPKSCQGTIPMLFVSWSFFGFLRNSILAAVGKEIGYLFDEGNPDRSCFKLMHGISRLTEWVVWFSV